jgi:hypothetical protein
LFFTSKADVGTALRRNTRIIAKIPYFIVFPPTG